MVDDASEEVPLSKEEIQGVTVTLQYYKSGRQWPSSSVF